MEKKTNKQRLQEHVGKSFVLTYPGSVSLCVVVKTSPDERGASKEYPSLILPGAYWSHRPSGEGRADFAYLRHDVDGDGNASMMLLDFASAGTTSHPIPIMLVSETPCIIATNITWLAKYCKPLLSTQKRVDWSTLLMMHCP